MSTAPTKPPVERVTTLELFVDLVFVFAITQLTTFLVEDLSWTSLWVGRRGADGRDRPARRRDGARAANGDGGVTVQSSRLGSRPT